MRTARTAHITHVSRWNDTAGKIGVIVTAKCENSVAEAHYTDSDTSIP